MDYQVAMNLISSVGFPIVAYFMLNKTLKEEREDHKEEVANLTKVIESNTVAITRLTDAVGDKPAEN